MQQTQNFAVMDQVLAKILSRYMHIRLNIKNYNSVIVITSSQRYPQRYVIELIMVRPLATILIFARCNTSAAAVRGSSYETKITSRDLYFKCKFNGKL